MADRKTDMKDGELIAVAVAAVKVEAGHLGALNASGYLAPAADTANFTAIGRIEETVDNSGGSAGDLSCLVRRLKAFKYKNSTTAAVTQATWARTASSRTRSPCPRTPPTTSWPARSCPSRPTASGSTSAKGGPRA